MAKLSDKTQSPQESAESAPRRRPVRLVLLVLSVLLMAVGVAASVMAGSDAESERNVSSYGMPGAGPAGLTGQPGTAEPNDLTSDGEGGGANWAPVVFRLGFSFFIGFAIAAALRAFLKLTFIFAGLFALMLFGLQYAGIIEIDWTLMEGKYDSVMEWARGQFASMSAFIMGYVPSAASLAAGFVVGFRK